MTVKTKKILLWMQTIRVKLALILNLWYYKQVERLIDSNLFCAIFWRFAKMI